jgi:lipooligosaccharide transport system ATP-binding protein
MPTDIIEADSLEKSFGHFRAVDDISFRVRRGECFGLLGPNGAGKTTTIRMLYGFTPRDGGSLRIFGEECDGDWRSVKGRIGVCQQENNLDPDLTVRQNLEVFAGYFDLPLPQIRERVGRLLGFTALEHREEAEVRELSGGMMRRLVLARALINEPELLILDEPTTGLDPQSRHQLWNRLERLKGEGLTVLLTTHYMDEAERLCDRLVIMDGGKILVEGSPRELIDAHVGKQVIEVVAPGDELRSFLSGRGVGFEDLGHRLIIYGGDGDGLYASLVRDFCREGCMLRPATLEDVFLRLTGRELRE